MNSPENVWPKDWKSQTGNKNIWPRDWQKIEHENPSLLEQCRGYDGQVCEYLISHSQLLVRFFAKRPLADALLYCTGCDAVRFQANSWKDVAVRVLVSRDTWGQRFTITDGERLYIACRTAALAESREMVISIPRLYD